MWSNDVRSSHDLFPFTKTKPKMWIPIWFIQFIFQIPTKYQGHCALETIHTPKE
jgi:hypothetical protein